MKADYSEFRTMPVAAFPYSCNSLPFVSFVDAVLPSVPQIAPKSRSPRPPANATLATCETKPDYSDYRATRSMPARSAAPSRKGMAPGLTKQSHFSRERVQHLLGHRLMSDYGRVGAPLNSPQALRDETHPFSEKTHATSGETEGSE